MEIIDQYWEWVQKPNRPLEIIEKAGRTCYKSEEKISQGSSSKFAGMIVKLGHETVIEHAVVSLRFVTNRGVTHELVRHRVCSFSQESTRYVRYDGRMQFIKPVWWEEWSAAERLEWTRAIETAESAYCALLKSGSRPEMAREVLPNSLKTEIVMTANLRELRHILKLRCSGKSHPQIRALMRSLLQGVHAEIPVIFDDLFEKYFH